MAMLEAFQGTAFWADWASPVAVTHPDRVAAAKAYGDSQQVFVQHYARLLSITHLSEAFNQIGVEVDHTTLSFKMDLSGAIKWLVADARAHPENGTGRIQDFIFSLSGNHEVTPAMTKQLREGLAPLGPRAVALVKAPVPAFVPRLSVK